MELVKQLLPLIMLLAGISTLIANVYKARVDAITLAEKAKPTKLAAKRYINYAALLIILAYMANNHEPVTRVFITSTTALCSFIVCNVIIDIIEYATTK
jgi:hypothetical protein